MNDSKTLKTSPRDFFLHLLHSATLYASAISFLVLVFQVVNVLIPDLAAGYYAKESYMSLIRISVAFLVVVFPVFIVTGWFLEKIYKARPEKKSLWVRKWLLYFTLFVAAIIMIGDVIGVVFNFLNGELTIKFIIKFGSVLAVAGSIFWYYLSGVRKEDDGLKV